MQLICPGLYRNVLFEYFPIVERDRTFQFQDFLCCKDGKPAADGDRVAEYKVFVHEVLADQRTGKTGAAINQDILAG